MNDVHGTQIRDRTTSQKPNGLIGIYDEPSRAFVGRRRARSLWLNGRVTKTCRRLEDALGLPAAIWVVAGLTSASGVVVAVRLSETLRRG